MQRLDGSTTLHDGTRLRLRMPQRRDRAALHALLERLGLHTDELVLSRVLHTDPREQLAVVATRLVGRSEELVGVAAMDRYSPDPDLVLADEARAPGARTVLEDTLRAHTARGHRTA